MTGRRIRHGNGIASAAFGALSPLPARRTTSTAGSSSPDAVPRRATGRSRLVGIQAQG